MKNSQRKRTVVSVFLVIMLTLLMPVTVFAGIQPFRWSHFAFITANMEVNDYNYATVDVTVDSDSGDVGSITVLLELQQLDGEWETIMEWEESMSGQMISFEKHYGVAKGYSYRLLVTATAYDKYGNFLEEVEDEEFGYGYYH